MSTIEVKARFPIISYDEASDETKAIYDDILKYHSFIPAWYKTQGNSPNILRGNWEKIKATLYMGVVPLVLKQIVLYSISKARGCKYCEAIHAIAANNFSSEFSAEESFSITDNLDSPFIPTSYKVAVKVLTKVALNPLKTTSEDYDQLSEEGFSDIEITELFAQVDLAILLNTYADISGVVVDEEALSSI